MSLEQYVVLLLLLMFLSQLVLNSAQDSFAPGCPSFKCGKLGAVAFPFSNISNPECGLAVMNCTGPQVRVRFNKHGKWYDVHDFNYGLSTIKIYDQDLQSELESNRCDSLNNFTENVFPFFSLNVTNTRPFYKCKHESDSISLSKFFKYQNLSSYTSCDNYDHERRSLYDLYFCDDHQRSLPSLPQNLSHLYQRSLPSLPENLSHLCSLVRLPYQPDNLGIDGNLTSLWNANFTIIWGVNQSCWDCNRKGGKNVRKMKVKIGLIAGGSGIILTSMVFIFLFIYCHRKKNKLAASSALISQSMSLDPSLKPDPEKGSTYFQTPIFTYKELHEATNHFDNNKKLGDGGFGTVYHGKLRDGRVVAVKRLFEHNYKRVEQFMNEIAILSLLRHRNLVTLYGCTNRHSRELLLVYEYVPNGTVADHLHGNRADAGLLTWPIRLTIAIETADALAYLHASDIIHRDVKTNNILLDNGFHVKVADFGMSRLFPMDVTHVSTAPQGTPGYVDPEYYQCYQLNDRSDVYSFGVVLIELISSKPAVDIGRHRHEINLANMAINRIHNQALHELVDPCLGFESDSTVRNTITLVAELAFRCLQQEKELRPCMVEVLETLRGIESADYKKKTDEIDISADARLLKNNLPFSPDSVTGEWVSTSTTPNTSN
ncbi:LEAF RUST 10 DISEASE-RESISTANCE LOCUS RECEPTOR-LIKE PROTEIN KINASE-like 1.1 [Thalictrum thalictroides]|uniref:non-specific serine/threonine protein kinase n=1 Tax=Thalictrum thalictroides TaxID=46969 RepID=A0A7J6VYL4_THATH|nr:LEAF RUST 10 DISEASE-RESISTANCE LOCUS RECEPTOR-LIKE PROTEIN KINASE-like 1.1 [Thalictrum thalictroides]